MAIRKSSKRSIKKSSKRTIRKGSKRSIRKSRKRSIKKSRKRSIKGGDVRYRQNLFGRLADIYKLNKESNKKEEEFKKKQLEQFQSNLLTLLNEKKLENKDYENIMGVILDKTLGFKPSINTQYERMMDVIKQLSQ